MSNTKVVTGEVRASYCNLCKPRVNQLNGNTEYSAELWIPKSDKATVKKIIDAMDASVNGKFDKKPAIVKKYNEGKAKFLKTGKSGLSRDEFHFPLRDADAEVKIDDTTGEEAPFTDSNPEAKGCYLLRVKAFEDNPPKMIDQQKNEILDDSIKSGDYIRVSMNAYAYSNNSKGVSFFINGGQLVREGDPLGSMTKVEDDFEAIEEDDWA